MLSTILDRMQLKSLLDPPSAAPHLSVPEGCLETEITGLAADSRAVGAGFLFAALPGSRTDGARYIPDALTRGAAAILAGAEASLPPTGAIPVLRSIEPRRTLARMAARFYGRQPETAVAITGTSGKTSVAEFTRQIFAACGHSAASLGTLGLIAPGCSAYGTLTTPDPVALHARLAELAAAGITHLAFEASSHGLDQYRLDGVKLKAGAFTNLGRDHLDYHMDEGAYFAAKLRLFRELLPPGTAAVVNADAPGAAEVAAAAREGGLRLLSVGEKGESLRLLAIEAQGFAQRVRFAHEGRVYEVRLPLAGAYQAANALLAAALALAAGEERAGVFAALEKLEGVKGRLEIVGERNGGLAVVDYAHKPDALRAVLDALRPFAQRRLICVFGCGGDRDQGKRPLMGRIASEKADIVIVTDDNPRNEAPEAIRAEILKGAPGAREIPGRAEAIMAAIALLGPGDVAVVAGKGHETGQIIGNSVLPFSDREAVEAALATLSI